MLGALFWLFRAFVIPIGLVRPPSLLQGKSEESRIPIFQSCEYWQCSFRTAQFQDCHSTFHLFLHSELKSLVGFEQSIYIYVGDMFSHVCSIRGSDLVGIHFHCGGI